MSRPASVTIPLDYRKRPRAPRDSQIGDYHVIAPIARGGTAGVYMGEHRATKERVALKVLDPYHADNADLVARLIAEHTVSAQVRHPGLVRISAAAKSPSGVPFLVMEYLDGENLGALAERGRMEVDAVTAIIAEVASALAALHEAGIVHCDVKADNVLVLYQTEAEPWPRIKVIDFGVARRIDDPPMFGEIAGTPAYMAPEQWRGRPTPKSDVYSLGCLLYELVTGEAPFHGTLPEVMVAHAERLPPRPAAFRMNIDDRVEDLIMRMLAKDPDMRPSMSELANELGRRPRDLSNVELAAAS